jgi:tetratricopeptide (TPR) repeat protein
MSRSADGLLGTQAPVALDDPRVIQAVEEYLAALERGPKPDRQEFLGRHPAIAEALAKCLDGLEFVHLAAPQLSRPSLTGPPGAAADIAGHGPLGDFRIVREVGRGGMGVVYEAEQISLGRRVALKVLPFAAALDAKQRQRFQHEAQAAAQLHHTNIVPIYGVGCERGVHFYAMQFIEGQTLAAMIRDLRQLAGVEEPGGTVGPAAAAPLPSPVRAAVPTQNPPTGPYTPLSCCPELSAAATTPRPVGKLSTERSTKDPAFFRTAAGLGLQAAEALEHAHQLGVVHRDIKPANLLVETTAPLSPQAERGQGVRLWIADFGLAQFHSDTGLTLTGDLVGTIRYMSPEQALAKRGIVDHRTDIYSLGVTLYELLTLQPAFAGNDRQQVLHQIAGEEPCPPRRLNKSVPADLETIVLKAMAKSPAERYATAQELADDLRRFLEDKPVLARRPTLAQRARRWARRHQTLVRAAMVMLVLLTVGSAISALLIWQAQQRTEQAYLAVQVKEKEATENFQEADENFKMARDAVDQMLTRVGEVKPARVPETFRRALLEDALKFYQKFLVHRRGNHPTIRQETGRAYQRVAHIYALLGQHEQAEEACRKGMSLFQALAAENPAEPSYWHDLAAIHNELGRLLRNVGRPLEAENAYRQGRQFLQEKLPAEFRSRTEHRELLAGLHLLLSGVLVSLGKTQEAHETLQQALNVRQELADEFPTVPLHWINLAICHNNLGASRMDSGGLKEAEDSFRRGLRLLEERADQEATLSTYREARALMQRNLAVVLEMTGRFEEANKLFRQSQEMRENLADVFRAVPVYRDDLAGTQTSLATLHKHAGLLKDAEKSLRLALEPRRKLVKDFTNVTDYRAGLASTLNGLGILLQERAELIEARQLFQEAIGHYQIALKSNPRHPWHRVELCFISANLARTLADLGQQDEAMKLFRQTIAVGEELAAEFPKVTEYQSKLAEWLLQYAVRLENWGELAEARRLLERATGHEQAALADNPHSLLFRRALSNHFRTLARIVTAQGKPGEAEKAIDQALAAAEQLVRDFPKVPDCRLELARVQTHQGNLQQASGRVPEAEKSYALALDLLEKLATDFPNVQEYQSNWGGTLYDLGMLRRDQGELVQARGLLEQACARGKAALEANPRHLFYRLELCNHLRSLAHVFSLLEEPEAAEKVSREQLTVSVALAKDYPNVPDGLENLAHGHATLGMILSKQSQLHEEEQKHYRQALALYAKLPAHFLIVPYSWNVQASTRHNLAVCVAGRGQLAEALELEDQAIRHQQVALRPDPRRQDYRHSLVVHLKSYKAWAETLAKRKEYAEAEKAFRRLRVLAGQAADDFPTVPDCRLLEAQALTDLGKMLADSGRPQQGEEVCRQGIVIFQEKLVEPGDSVYQEELTLALRSLAFCVCAQGQLAQALEVAEQEIRRHEASLKADPQDRTRRQRLQVSLDYSRFLAETLWAQKIYDEAEKAYRQLGTLAEEVADRFPDLPGCRWHQAQLLTQLGSLLLEVRAFGKAEEVYRQVIPVLQKKLVEPYPSNPDYQSKLGASLHNLAVGLEARQQWAEACELYKQAIPHQRAALAVNPKHPTYRQFFRNHYGNLADILFRMGNHEELAKVAVEIPRSSPETWKDFHTIAGYLLQCVMLARKDAKLTGAQQKALAEKYAGQLKQPLQDAIQRCGNDAVAHNTLARFLAFAPDPLVRDPARALPLAKRAVELAPKDGNYWNTLAGASYRTGDWQAAVTALEKSMEFRQGGDSFNWFFLAMAHWQLGHKDEARQWYDRAVAWMEKNLPGDEILRGLRVEAAALLGLKDPSAPKEQ